MRGRCAADGFSSHAPRFRAAELLFRVQLGKDTSAVVLNHAREDFGNDETN